VTKKELITFLTSFDDEIEIVSETAYSDYVVIREILHARCVRENGKNVIFLLN